MPDQDSSAGPTTKSFGHGRSRIMAWARTGRLPADKLLQAAQLAGFLPDRRAWRSFLDGFALWLGVLLLALSVIFFLAYNWSELGRYLRFALVELLLTGSVVAAWRIGLDRMSGKSALLAATLMIGALLALVGQTYQTGADPWELFAVWALCVLPWTIISRFPPLWLLWLTLVNLTISLYHHAFSGLFGMLFQTESLIWLLAGLNTSAVAAWELAAGRGIPWLQERWPIRALATVSAGQMTVLFAWGILDRDVVGIAESIGYLVWLLSLYCLYRRRIRDLYILALGMLSLVISLSVFLGHLLARDNDASAFLLVGMVVLGLSAAGGWWLRSVAREVDI